MPSARRWRPPVRRGEDIAGAQRRHDERRGLRRLSARQGAVRFAARRGQRPRRAGPVHRSGAARSRPTPPRGRRGRGRWRSSPTNMPRPTSAAGSMPKRSPRRGGQSPAPASLPTAMPRSAMPCSTASSTSPPPMCRIDKAGELGRAVPTCSAWCAVYRARRRQFDRASAAIERAQALDPLNPSLFKTAGRIRSPPAIMPAAIAAARRALEINPAISGAHGDIGNALLMQAGYDEAAAEFAAGKGRPAGHSRQGDRRHPPPRQEPRPARHSTSSSRPKGTTACTSRRRSSPSGARRLPRSMRSIGRSAEADSGLVYLLSDPFLEPLHEQPRFKSLLRKLHFV